MSSADSKDRYLRLGHEVAKSFEMCRIVVIEILIRAAKYDRIRREITYRVGNLGKVHGHRLRILNEPDNILSDVVTGHGGNLSLEPKLRFYRPLPLRSRKRREIALIPKQAIYDQYTCVLDLLLDRFVLAISSPVIRKW